jgi:HK97 family phage major capsid protein
MADLDASGFIPTPIAAELFSAAQLESAGKASIPIPAAYPVAQWVNAASPHRKPYTDVHWTAQNIVAEEVAATFSIPQAFLDDASVDMWALVKPTAATALALAIDQAILFGDGAPASFPVGGVVGNLASISPQTPDLAGGVSDAMAEVEATGLVPSGHAAKPSVRAGLRNMRTLQGEPLYLPSIQPGAPFAGVAPAAP